MNRLFVAYKPTGMSSNQLLSRLKRRYGIKKAGYSGTLDPFAKGVLIIAFGNHGRLFRFLNKTPKQYRATLWLGAYSPTLDIEKIETIDELEPFELSLITSAIDSLHGEITYLPPKYSAKRINGKRAYELARAGIDVELKTITSTIHEIKLLHYCHPFVTFEANVSEGSYIRSLGEMIADKLGCEGSLTALERLNEGQFFYDNEKEIDIKTALSLPKNRYNGDTETILLGQPLYREQFEEQLNGTYWLDNGSTISIIEIADDKIHYILNKVEAC
ncbi:MAG: tRNA pseudouridine(55) synthase TruB [Sulfuricurvum sp.]|uniref:tRNA pseudouridine(55) synthase TruB n=1 Tax=Sulfuricurvum sp. TaxID=2025608 RepID=UPI00260891B6|nr:tRNA pseudouridine(55) synthase TruB [Sulfuricurvum sp.]MDD2829191.1 tRNA pseudouridine(55) synthase TruB [Sulfuricurvum sp.]MDD4949024.1 tRNA pseudouridine(55) synthase TruB [Sulfuricurvum sp.]